MMSCMKDFSEYFAGKRVTVMGLGLLGRGVGDVAFLAEMGAELIVTDLKTEEVLSDSLSQLASYDNITYVLGEHREEDFKNRDFVLVAPSVPLDSVYLETARAAGIPLKQSAAWFAEVSRIPIIGVTGTRGKSTVTQMIHHVLSVVTGEKVLLGGNIRGVSNLQLLKNVQEDSLCVMELDSWQLQGWGWNHMSPQVAVFTNFMEDHQNYYGSMDLYFNDKAQIFLHQDESGVLITTPEVFERAKELSGVSLGQEVVLADASVIPEGALLTMPGEHNRLNTALAVETLKALSLSEDEIFTALATFPGVEGRLQYLGEIEGVKMYNDNNATTPTATAAGVRAVSELIASEKGLVLIAGGADKGLDVQPIIDAVESGVKAIILLPGSGTEMLLSHIHGSLVNSMEEGVTAALAAAESGDSILFSPGFASFGLFRNEYERNDAFLSEVNKKITE